jgi:tetratricopeptide (TPR) repeat protein
LLNVAAAVGLIAFVWLSVQVYRSKTDPEHFGAWNGPLAWMVGPPAVDLLDAARRHMEMGLKRLNDTSSAPADRIRLYRDELARAEVHLVRSLRTRPIQAHALAALAAVRWELNPPLTRESVRNQLDLVTLASGMAPTDPEVQMQLGELLLKMGRREEGLGYLVRTVELDPETSDEVIRILRNYLFAADEIAARLPSHRLVLAHLEEPYFEDSKTSEYLLLLEGTLAEGGSSIHPILLTHYGIACLRLRDAERLAARMEALGELPDPEAEAERLVQLARALVASGDPASALDHVDRAIDLRPSMPRLVEYRGDVALWAGMPDDAIASFRDSLRLLAESRGAASSRARLYRRIGQAEEAAGRPDRAYDAYKRALELNPDQTYALARVRAMEDAAGFD